MACIASVGFAQLRKDGRSSFPLVTDQCRRQRRLSTRQAWLTGEAMIKSQLAMLGPRHGRPSRLGRILRFGYEACMYSLRRPRLSELESEPERGRHLLPRPELAVAHARITEPLVCHT